MVKFDATGFGWIVIDGKKYRRDMMVFPDGRVEKRKGGILIFGGHTFKREEIEKLWTAKSEVVVIGTGTSGLAKVADDAKTFAEEKRLELIELLSHEAIKKFNDLTGKRGRLEL